MKRNKAVFMDRDGTINEEVGYLSRLEQLKVIPGVPEAIKKIHEAGMLAIVVTNQSGVARGFFDEGFVKEVHGRINEILSQQGARIDRFYFCPHHPTAGEGPYRTVCSCRKPEPGMLHLAAEELDIDLSRSYVIGDMLRDVDIARRVGAKGILVRTGYGRNITITDKPAYIASDLPDAVEWIIKNEKP